MGEHGGATAEIICTANDRLPYELNWKAGIIRVENDRLPYELNDILLDTINRT